MNQPPPEIVLEWLEKQKTMLQETGMHAKHAEGNITHQYEISTQANNIIALTDMCIITVSGAQAKEFLQGQITSDINLVDENHFLPAACCDHRGRVISNFFIYQTKNNYFLLSNSSIAEDLTEHLNKFGKFSKVLSYIEPKVAALLISSKKWNQEINLSRDSKTLDYEKYYPGGKTIHHENMTILQPNYDLSWCIADLNTLDSYWSTKIKKNNLWLQGDINIQYKYTIKNNLPTISKKTSLLWTPAMINWTKHAGVSFEKGCFVGQEIIARTHNLGKGKRHLYKIQLKTNNPITPGSEIIAEDNSKRGHVVNFYQKNQSYECLAVIEDRAANNQEPLSCQESIVTNITPC